jgi:chromosome segregation ATPase
MTQPEMSTATLPQIHSGQTFSPVLSFSSASTTTVSMTQSSSVPVVPPVENQLPIFSQSLGRVIEEMKKQVAEQKSELDQLRKQGDEQKRQNGELKKQNETLKKQLREQEAKNTAQQVQISAQQKAIASGETEAKNLITNIQKKDAAAQEHKQSHQALLEQFAVLQAGRDTITEELKEAKKEKAKLTTDHALLQGNLQAAESRVKQLEAMFAKLQQEKQQLEKTVALQTQKITGQQPGAVGMANSSANMWSSSVTTVSNTSANTNSNISTEAVAATTTNNFATSSS